MVNDTTRADLRTRTLDFADMTGSSFPVTARVDEYLNDGLAKLHDLIVNSKEDYFRVDKTYTIVNGTEAYQLPDNFFKGDAVYYVTAGRRFKVERWQHTDIDGYRNSPLSAGTVEMWYTPVFAKMTDDLDRVDSVLPSLPPGWEVYAAYHAASQLLKREESFEAAAVFDQEKQELQGRIVQLLEDRDTFVPDSIGDYYGRWEQTRHLLHVDERYFRYRIMGTKIYFIEVEYFGA